MRGQCLVLATGVFHDLRHSRMSASQSLQLDLRLIAMLSYNYANGRLSAWAMISAWPVEVVEGVRALSARPSRSLQRPSQSLEAQPGEDRDSWLAPRTKVTIATAREHNATRGGALSAVSIHCGKHLYASRWSSVPRIYAS